MGVDGLTLTVTSASVLDDSDPGIDSVIGVNDANTIDIQVGSILLVSENGGFGIRGDDDNDVTLAGSIVVDATNGRAISIGTSSFDTQSSRVTTEAGSIISLNLDNGIGIEAGDDVSITHSGTLNLLGTDARGIVVGDRGTLSQPSVVLVGGTIQVGDGTMATANGIGIVAGDGWYPNDVDAGTAEPSFQLTERSSVALNPGGIINVNSIGGAGIRVGDDANLVGNQNSVVFNGGTIAVIALDAVGVSVGGNDFLDASQDPDDYSFINTSSGMLTGTDMHGPLVEFRAFNSTFENRVRNEGSILADLTLQGMPGRALAIVGTAGVEIIRNDGTIQGDILLGDGDDRFELGGAGSYTGNLDGQGGRDEFRLLDQFSSVPVFDVSQLLNFEMLRVGGGNGWTLVNASGFSGTTQIDALGVLVAPDPLTLGGDFVVDPTGTLRLSLDENNTAFTIAGTATLDGTLIVDSDDNLPSDPINPYPLIAAIGGASGTFSAIQFTRASELRRFTPLYDASGLSVLYEVLSFEQAAQTQNQIAIAGHLSAILAAGGAPPLLQRLLNDLTNSTESVSAVFTALSPEAYDAQTTIIVEGGRRIARLLLDRPRDCQTDARDPGTRLSTKPPCHSRRWSPWLATIGSFRSRDKFAGFPRYDAQLGGLIFGIDARPIGGLDLTFAIASQRGSVDVAGAESSTVTLTDLSGHAAWTHGALRLQSVVSWGHGFHRDRRVIRHSAGIDNPLDLRGLEKHDSDRITLAGEVGFRFDAGPIQIEPLATVDWAWVFQRPIQESEAGSLGIRIDARSDQLGSVSGGLRASSLYHQTGYLLSGLDWMDGVWRPQIDLRWRQIIAGDKRDIDARFRGTPAGVPDFTIQGREDKGGFEIGAGVSFVPSNANRLQMDLRYEAFVASHTLEQTLSFRVSIGF
ncbi:MAG: autotransporter outer membrane beta-barrel domain-containing protein [Myxococcota bacterium]